MVNHGFVYCVIETKLMEAKSPAIRICMIAYTHYSTDPRVKREAEAIAQQYPVDVITLEEPQNIQPDYSKITFHPLKLGRFRAARKMGYLISYFLFCIKAFFKLNKLDFKHNYNVVYFHTMPDFVILTAVIQKLKGAKLILDIHDLFPELFILKFKSSENSLFYKLLLQVEKFCANFADTVITVHHVYKNILEGRINKNVQVVLNVADDKIFNPSKRLPVKEKKIVYHGTISKRLGMDSIIEAAELFQGKNINDIFFSIIGIGEYAETFQQKIKEKSLENFVKFDNRFYPVQDLPGIIGDSFFGIIPLYNNLSNKKTLSVKMFEYVSLKIPVITSDLDSTRFYFDDEQMIYFNPDNVKELFNKIVYFADHYDEALKMADKAYKRAFESYSWPKDKKKLLRIVERSIY